MIKLNDVQKELYKAKSRLRCSECYSEDLETRIAYDGLTTHGFVLQIECNNCGVVNEIARLTSDSSSVVVSKDNINCFRK